jgi:thiamine biosynthesis lipoprotein
MKPTRRDFLTLGVGALAVVSLPRVLRRKEKLLRRQIPVMGTIAEVAIRHRDEAWAQRAIDEAFFELRRVDRTMTRFSADSDVGRINRAAPGSAVRVSDDTAAVLASAPAWAEVSDGRFDPCLGRAVELWDVGGRTAPPRSDRVAWLEGGALYQALELDGPTARLHRAEAAVDLGGIAKGFGVDAAARALQDLGIFHALINVGGDLVALGVGEDEEPWRIGVRSPDEPDSMIEVLEVSDRAVATSGDYLQYFQHGGRRYHHLLDPVSAEPRRTAMRSLTVEAATCIEADAAATALFGAPEEVARVLLERGARGARVAHSV